jgi:glutathione S-transferase
VTFSAIGEVPAIMRYLDEAVLVNPLLGATPKEKGLIFMWERRAELEGFAAVMEGVRNKIAVLKGRAIAGPHDYEQIPALVERSALRVKNFFADFNERLGQVPFVAGERYSAADVYRPGDSGLCQGARAVRAGGSHRAEALV